MGLCQGIPASNCCLLLFLLLFFFPLNCHGLPSQESEAIWTLRTKLGIESLWKLPANPCEFTGITCERITDEIRVTRIVLPRKNLAGFLPPEIGEFTALKELSLPRNFISGGIPVDIQRCTELEELNLRENNFSGKVPLEFSSLVSLQHLDLSYNQFSGGIQFLKKLTGLETVFLTANSFSDKLSPSLGNFPYLVSVDFSNNNFHGPIPVALSRFSVNPANFSGNRQLYSIPKRFMLAENLTNSINHSNTITTSNFSLPPPLQKNPSRKASYSALGFFIGVASGILAATIASAFFRSVITIIRGHRHLSEPIIYSLLIKKSDLRFLKSDAALDSVEIIGRGGCGEVYRCEWPRRRGHCIAIKHISQPSAADTPTNLPQGESKNLNVKLKQIQSELESVGYVRHRNLLPLLAYVPRPDCHYLVYEYMKNGSLQHIMSDIRIGNRDLYWPIRHRIAMGIAAGLQYLHFSHSPKIIHRDLKPANVLLDDHLEPRIADFGLAMSMPDANTHVTTTNIAGTFGYIAPEYHQTLHFTDKCDVYSFGIILAVLVTGRFPSDEFFLHNEEFGMVKWVRSMVLSRNTDEAFDPSLRENGFDEQMWFVLKVACFCILDEPKERPNSKDVYQMLAQIKH